MNRIKILWKDRKNQTHYIKWLAHYTKPYLFKICIIMVLNLGTSLLGVLMALVSKEIIDSATSTFSKNITFMLCAYVGITVLVQLFTIVQTLMSIMLNEKFSFGIRKQIYDKIIRSEWMQISKYHTGDLMTRLTSDAGNVADGIVTTIPQIIKLFAELIIVFFTLFAFSKLLAVFALMLAPLSGIISLFLGRKLKKLQVKVQESEAKYRSFLQESLANVLIIKAFTNEEQSMDKLIRLRDNRFYWVYKKSKLGVIVSTAMSCTFQIGYIGAFTYGVFQISRNVITYGTMTVFLTLVNRVQAPILELAQQLPKVVSIVASAGRIIELQNIPLEKREERTICDQKIGVDVNHLTFGYTDEPVLEDTELHIRPSEFVAIVGESGIGKTTLIRILMSFLTMNRGEVEFYDAHGHKEPLNASNREFISYVPQGNTLFSGTIRDNLLTGKEDATDDEIIEALKMACAYEFVNELPDGLNTVLGEKGHGLSEGQSQRIAIARAIIRRAPVMILDEATSALDEKTELSVLHSIRSIPARPTCVLITHRRSVLDYCDRELIIQEKKIHSVSLREKRKIEYGAI
ncbi:MAG: ABC transporter ATP-binding protein [bacterium]|nr:ABC transporter ATP-binding protein [bacterium]